MRVRVAYITQRTQFHRSERQEEVYAHQQTRSSTPAPTLLCLLDLARFKRCFVIFDELGRFRGRTQGAVRCRDEKKRRERSRMMTTRRASKTRLYLDRGKGLIRRTRHHFAISIHDDDKHGRRGRPNCLTSVHGPGSGYALSKSPLRTFA